MGIAERIRNRREELNMSQDELARKIGYRSRSSINKIELGHYNLTQSKIKAIADALDTTPSYIMGWDEGPTVPDPVNVADHIKLSRYYDMCDADGRSQIMSYAAALAYKSQLDKKE